MTTLDQFRSPFAKRLQKWVCYRHPARTAANRLVVRYLRIVRDDAELLGRLKAIAGRRRTFGSRRFATMLR